MELVNRRVEYLCGDVIATREVTSLACFYRLRVNAVTASLTMHERSLSNMNRELDHKVLSVVSYKSRNFNLRGSRGYVSWGSPRHLVVGICCFNRSSV